MCAQPYRNQRSDAGVDAAAAEHGRAACATLPVLQTVQAGNRGYLSPALLGAVADALRVSDARVQGVATFYSLLSTQPRPAKVIRVCDSPVCMLQGGESARAALEAEAAACPGWHVERCSCLGLCDRAPAALREATPCGPNEERPDYSKPLPGETRVVMARIGRIDPASIQSAIEAGAYQALAGALAGSAAMVLDAVEQSGLRGCGGAGFPTGRKWRMAAGGPAPRHVICNADESEPGTFKDRVLMEGDPHRLLEGLVLAGYAVSAASGIIYLRGEYEWIAQRLEAAITQAEERNWLGENIQGSGFSFRVRLHRGAGAYICGEETALLESLEGKRGEPRCRPPYPTVHGYLGRPTVINNVETLCQVPGIAAHGPDWFRSLGTPDHPGTKVFAVTGCISRPGAFETPPGITLRQAIEQFGGGMRGGRRFKAALAGGVAGRFVPPSLLDVPIGRPGVPLGSGAMMILDETVSIPQFLTWVLRFLEAESCGKCTPCREGTREARLLAERAASGLGSAADAAELLRLARMMNRLSLCGLGQSAAGPVESALEYFGEEFTAPNIE